MDLQVSNERGLIRIRRAINRRILYPAFRAFHRFVVYKRNDWLLEVMEDAARLSRLTGTDRFVDRWAYVLNRMGLRQRHVAFLDWAARNVNQSKYQAKAMLARAANGEIDVGDIGEIVQLNAGTSVNYFDYLSLLKFELITYAQSQKKDILGFGQQQAQSDDLAARAYRLMWLAHQVNDGAKVDYYARTYAQLTRFDLPSIRNIIVNIAAPTGRHHLALDLLEKAEARLRETKAKLRKSHRHTRRSGAESARDMPEAAEWDRQFQELLALRNQALYELGLPLESRGLGTSATSARNPKQHYWTALFAKQNNDTEELVRHMHLYLRHASSGDDAEFVHLAHFHLACHYEAVLDNQSAEFHYMQMLLVEGIPYYLPNTTWRYVTFLMALDRWPEAAVILAQAGRILWQSYKGFARVSFARRCASGNLIPKGKFVMLGCQGLGDEIIRLGLLSRYRKLDSDIAITIDPRMQSLLARSFPGLELIPISRQSGKFAVTEAEYWKDREGVPEDADLARITRKGVEAFHERKDLIISEDAFLHYVSKRGKFPSANQGPLLKVDEDKFKAARQWVDSLPGVLKVGISWRSGFRDKIRSESYVDVMDLGPVWSLPDVTFFSLQYSDTEEEEAEVRDNFGAVLHKMPGVDRRDDLDELAALSLAADVVIAPGTAARELAGAVGANTLSLTTTPVLPDLWRTEEDREVDTIFPSIRHLNTFHHKDKEGVIEELARRLQAMVSERQGGGRKRA